MFETIAFVFPRPLQPPPSPSRRFRRRPYNYCSIFREKFANSLPATAGIRALIRQEAGASSPSSIRSLVGERGRGKGTLAGGDYAGVISVALIRWNGKDDLETGGWNYPAWTEPMGSHLCRTSVPLCLTDLATPLWWFIIPRINTRIPEERGGRKKKG